MSVDGMTCPSCEHHVEKALRSAGARDAEADFRRGEALLSVDGDPNAPALAAAIQAAGYSAGPLELLETIRPHHDGVIRYRLPVEGMTCADCERHVTEALQGAGATDLEANFRQGEARFTTPKTIEPSRFVAALAETPYRPGTPEPLMPESTPARRNGRPNNGD